MNNPYATDWWRVREEIPDRTAIATTIHASTFNYGDLNASVAISAAVNACPLNQVVLLGPGQFKLDDPINIKRSNVTLRGSGMGKTILFKPFQTTNEHLVLIGSDMYNRTVETTAVLFAEDGKQGSYSIKVTNPMGINPGQIVKIDADEWTTAGWMPDAPLTTGEPMEIWGTDRTAYRIRKPEMGAPNIPLTSLDDYSRYGRTISEIKEVLTVSGDVVTFTSPLHIDYPLTKAPQLVRYRLPHNQFVGLENLTLTGGSDGNLRVTTSAHCWARGIESSHYGGVSVNMMDNFRFQLRDSYIHHANNPVPGGGAYAVSMRSGSSECLIENNIIMYHNKLMVARSAGAGSVIAYNYAQDSLINYDLNFQEVGINASHYPCPHHVLFEGNQSSNYDSDFTFGSSIYMTVLRNYCEGKRLSFPIKSYGRSSRCIGLMQHSWWHIFIGNVLGFPEMDAKNWIYEDMCDGTLTTGPSACAAKGAIWRLGYSSVQFQMSDPLTHQRAIREGNFDYLTRSVNWDTSPQVIPDSYYLTEKPEFFGDLPWPWVTPLDDDQLHQLPAKKRYDCMMGE